MVFKSTQRELNSTNMVVSNPIRDGVQITFSASSLALLFGFKPYKGWCSNVFFFCTFFLSDGVSNPIRDGVQINVNKQRTYSKHVSNPIRDGVQISTCDTNRI